MLTIVGATWASSMYVFFSHCALLAHTDCQVTRPEQNKLISSSGWVRKLVHLVHRCCCLDSVRWVAGMFSPMLMTYRIGPTGMGAAVRSIRAQARCSSALFHRRHLLVWFSNLERPTDTNDHPVLYRVLWLGPRNQHRRGPG